MSSISWRSRDDNVTSFIHSFLRQSVPFGSSLPTTPSLLISLCLHKSTLTSPVMISHHAQNRRKILFNFVGFVRDLFQEPMEEKSLQFTAFVLGYWRSELGHWVSDHRFQLLLSHYFSDRYRQKENHVITISVDYCIPISYFRLKNSVYTYIIIDVR